MSRESNSIDESRLSLLMLLAVVLRYRSWVLSVPLVCGAFAIVLSVSQQRTYTASASFMPQTDQAVPSGGLGGLAAQFNLSLGSPGGESPAFYAQLLKSDAVLREIAAQKYTIVVNDHQRTGSLCAVLGIQAPTADHCIAEAARFLDHRLSVETDRETSTIRLRVTTVEPELAQQLAAMAVEAINRFNLEKRQSQAVAERQFAKARLAEARAELLESEQRAQRFLERNRQFENSPTLRFEYDRLQREIDLRQQLASSLILAYEQARLDAVRNTAMITVIDPPRIPLEGNSRNTLREAIFASGLGLLVVLMAIFIREYVRFLDDTGDQSIREIQRLMRTDPLLPWQQLKRLGRRR